MFDRVNNNSHGSAGGSHVPTPGKINVIQILQLAPVFGSIYDIFVVRSRWIPMKSWTSLSFRTS